ncbi:TIGR04086 family membrane protein [Bacillota bacterium LX-D]|nr:TIGR04086 family membrane protein [Bacillota bacterium LX-D]
MPKSSKDKNVHSNHLNPTIIGFFNAIIVTIMLVITLSLFFYFSSFSEYHLSNLSVIVVVLSVFWGGFKAANLTETNLLLHSLGVGFLYLIFTILLAILISEPLSFISICIKLLYCLGAGAAGGVVGASFK